MVEKIGQVHELESERNGYKGRKQKETVFVIKNIFGPIFYNLEAYVLRGKKTISLV